MSVIRFVKTVSIENRQHEATIELIMNHKATSETARHHDYSRKERISILVTLRNVIYKCDCTLDDILVNLAEYDKRQVLSDLTILFECFGNFLDINIIDINKLVILVKLFVWKNEYDISVRCKGSDKDKLYNLMMVKIDDVYGKLKDMKRDDGNDCNDAVYQLVLAKMDDVDVKLEEMKRKMHEIDDSDDNDEMKIEHDNMTTGKSLSTVSVNHYGNCPNCSKFTLCNMISNKQDNVASMLIARGHNIEEPNKDKITPLIMACRTSNIGMVRLLLDNGADPDAPDGLGHVPLFFACLLMPNDMVMINILFDHGADPNIVDYQGNSILSHVVAGCKWEDMYDKKKKTMYIEVAYLLIMKGANYDHKGSKEMGDHNLEGLSIRKFIVKYKIGKLMEAIDKCDRKVDTMVL